MHRRNSHYLCCVLTFLWLFDFVYTQDLTTRLNFEKYYNIEEELISISEAIMHQEKLNHESDVHGLFNLSGPIDRIKTIHKNVVSSYRLPDYFSHPLNLFHLTKRLLTIWKEVADLILESATCVKNMRVKLQNIVDNIPEEKQFNYIAYRISKLQIFQKLSPADIMKGTISGMQPEEPMNISDAFDIGKAAFDNEDYYTAIDWLEYIDEQLKSNKHKESDINRTTVLSKLSSAYFKNGWIDKALKVTTELLKIDSNNKMAKRNKNYFESVKNSVKPKPDNRPEPSSKFNKLYREICRGDTRKNSSVSARLTCAYLPWKNQTKYERPSIEVMVYNKKPLIIKFPNMLGKSITKAVKFLGYDDMIWFMGKAIYRAPKDKVAMEDKTYHKWFTKIRKIITNIKLSDQRIHRPTLFIQNIGMNGYKEKYKKYQIDSRSKPLGSIVGFLTEPSLGGELVFPMSKTYIPVSMGDVVFYEEGARMSLCPVMYGQQWYLTSTLSEFPRTKESYLERRVPKL